MTNFQVVLTVVISALIYILFLFLVSYFFKAWGKIVVYIPTSPDGLARYVVMSSDSKISFSLVLADAHDFGTVRKARKVVRELEQDGMFDFKILEVYSVHKTGIRKSLPWF